MAGIAQGRGLNPGEDICAGQGSRAGKGRDLDALLLGLYLAEDRDPIGGRTLTNPFIVVSSKAALRAGRGQGAVALHDQDHLR